MYALGIDLGTTFTAAAVWRDGRAEISSLGSRSAAIPSVVVLHENETIITGEAASRRALTAPHRVAREFKRRLGDTTPILLGGSPYSAEALMARVLRAVIDEVTAREGGPPTTVCVSHPANWGPYKTDLLRGAVRGANLEDARFTTEPEAAAVFYARQQRMPDDAVIAVYDLGGGTFDAAVLRKNEDGFEILGRPEGIERLGGIDFDAAVFAHVVRSLGPAFEDLDEDDTATINAVARLRDECTAAKEALSSDTDTTIPVLLPNLNTEIRLTRAELESMVRPALQDSIDALRRALRSAGVTPEQLHSVLLVGGSSRMPIVAQLVGAELGRPVAVDVHPKHAVALGAAWLASGMPNSSPTRTPVQPKRQPEPQPQPEPVRRQAAAGLAAVAQRGSNPASSTGPVTPTSETEFIPVVREPVARSTGSSSLDSRANTTSPATENRASTQNQASTQNRASTQAGSAETRQQSGNSWDQGRGILPVTPVLDAPPRLEAPSDQNPRPRRGRLQTMALAALAAVVVIVIAVVAVLVIRGKADKPSTANAASCTSAIKANIRWVCLTSATSDGNQLTVKYTVNFAGATSGYDLHVWGSNGKTPADKNEGKQSLTPATWYAVKQALSGSTSAIDSSVQIPASDKVFKTAIGSSPILCARVATSPDDVLVKDQDGHYVTGNCIPITSS
jgi:molecular chaperone DnaK